MYKSLRYNDYTSDGVIVDAFGNEKYKLNIDAEWVTEAVDLGYDRVEFEIEVYDVAGAGSLYYEESVDRLNWSRVQANSTDVKIALTTDDVHRIKDFTVVPNTWRRFVLETDTLTSGYVFIKYME